MSQVIDFDKLQVPELRAYLQNRGITVSGYRKAQLVQIAKFIHDIKVPVDPDYANDVTEVDIKRRLAQIQFPVSDPFKLADYSSDFTEIPEFSLYDIFNYLLLYRTDYDKRKLKAFKSAEDYRLFYDGHVQELQHSHVSRESEICAFKAQVKPTQRDKTFEKKEFYDLWFLMHKLTGEVKAAYCCCPGGADGACRHVAASLYALEDYEKRSPTDGPCTWKKRPRGHDEAVPICQLRIVKASYRKEEVAVREAEIYDPRTGNREGPTEEKIKSFVNDLQKANPEACVIDYLREPQESDSETNTVDCTYLSASSKVANFLKSYKGNAENIVTDFLKDFKLSEDEVSAINEGTMGQSKNPIWFKMRTGIITASKFQTVCQTRSHDEIINDVLGENSETSKFKEMCMDWGINKEPKARFLYSKSEGQKHTSFHVHECGLKVQKDSPYIGCSSDGYITCSCHKPKLIEIKCPFVFRNKHPKEAASQRQCFHKDGNWHLSKDSNYFYQIQGQLGIYELEQCDLVIYTNLGIHVVPVMFDAKFFNNMVSQLSKCYVDFILPKLFEKMMQKTNEA